MNMIKLIYLKQILTDRSLIKINKKLNAEHVGRDLRKDTINEI